MYRVLFVFFMLLSSLNLMSQVRFGWRSIYDTSGRLSQMNYYENGISDVDSNCFFQYYTDNVVKGIVTGEMTREEGCKNGSVLLLDETGALTSYTMRRNGQTVFSTSCEYMGNCLSSWVDQFDVDTRCWDADSFDIENGELVIHNDKSLAVSLYNPPESISINDEFVLQTKIPKENNSSRLGVVLGWKDSQNYLLFEILYGEYFSVIRFENGELKQIGNARMPISKNGEAINEIRIINKNRDLIFEVNQTMEMVIPVPEFIGEKVGLITRSKGDARFQDFIFQHIISEDDFLSSEHFIGKGTGFFISLSGKILTTYDAVYDARNIRVKGVRNGDVFVLPAEIFRVEEDKNLAILQIKSDSFIPFSDIPFGYGSAKPVSESSVFSIGFPNAVSGIVIEPEIFFGKVLPSSTSSTNMLLEMSFRYGMIGSPIFDSNANLIGIVSNKGLEMRYTEAIDFYGNARLLQGYMGRSERSVDSPLKQLSQKEKIKALSDVVVIIESSILSRNDN